MGRSRDDGPTGICVVDKPAGWTSHDVVARSRSLLGTRRVGHAGTLDPMATGVLVLGVGRATRLLTFVTGVDKTYEARVLLGSTTDSLDADGEVTATFEMAPPSLDEVVAAAAGLTGALQQVPPMVSAVKVGGRRLHELAREGVEVERAPRPVVVRRFDVRPTGDPMVWDATVECSSGTYVRVLADDLGRALGGGAHLGALRRTAVGPFLLAEAQPLETPRLLPPVEGVRHLPQVVVGPEVAARVAVGQVLPTEVLGVGGPREGADGVGGPREGADGVGGPREGADGAGGPREGADGVGEGDRNGPWAVLGPDGDLLAVYAAHRGGTAKPSLVLAAG